MMKPCSDFTHQLEAEDCTTLSSVLVAIVELRHHLEQTVSATQGTIIALRN